MLAGACRQLAAVVRAESSAGAQAFRRRLLLRVPRGDPDLLSAGGTCGSDRKQADRAAAEDEDAIAEMHVAETRRMDDDRQRLRQRSHFVIHGVWEAEDRVLRDAQVL